KLVKTIQEVREEVKKARGSGKVVGFVPTMGALHQGHLSLVKRARNECSFVVVSIFVNPTQFGPGEDFARYPRQLSADLTLLEKERVEIVFAPSTEEMYPADSSTVVEVPKLSKVLEGKFRPGHFRGVCTVVVKLFNIVQPDFAYFGWKDAQQLIIIKQMVRDLNFPLTVVGCPTVREADGLAASSRNVYLSERQRALAPVLYQTLKLMEAMVKAKKITETRKLVRAGRQFLMRHSGLQLQYLKAVDSRTLQPVPRVKPGVLVAAAVKVGRVRLIDNILF
ncbi:MAG TPA: pantoate--beta-alanine ligase, partial [bacterium]|nr:pantoate--beta-alanine ligase [bacterium]